jgi:hypothetical protein
MTCELSLNDTEIHHYPTNIRKSIKMQHKMRPGFHRRSKANSDVT